MSVLLQERSIDAIPLRGLQPRAGFGDGRDGCGNPACSGSWLSFLKDRRRPMFEGLWGCTSRCVEAMVEAAIRRESGEGDAVEEESEHRHRVPLGLILLGQGWITQEQLQDALERQREAGQGRIGRWLVEECGLREERVTRGLGLQWRCPVLSMEGFDAAAMALTAPKVLLESTGMLSLRIAGRRILYLGFEDRLDAAAAFAMKRMSGLRVESGLVDEAAWREARQRLCECEFAEVALERLADEAGMASAMAAVLGSVQPRASRLVRVHQVYWLRMWLEDREGGVPARKEGVVDRIYTIGEEQ